MVVGYIRAFACRSRLVLIGLRAYASVLKAFSILLAAQTSSSKDKTIIESYSVFLRDLAIRLQSYRFISCQAGFCVETEKENIRLTPKDTLEISLRRSTTNALDY